MGKIIVIEGLDGSGKRTQSNLLKTRLIKENHHLCILDFPQYQNPSSHFVRQYLSGAYGQDATSVSPKQASLCYAMDRFDAFRTNEQVKQALQDPNAIPLANRYVTSNILYQAAKLATPKEMYALIDWLCELEYGILEIPKPDLVIMPVIELNRNMAMLKGRDIAKNASENNMSTDIHETNQSYLRQVALASRLIAEYMGFNIIDCMTEDGAIRSKEDIHEEIYDHVNRLILKPMRDNK